MLFRTNCRNCRYFFLLASSWLHTLAVSEGLCNWEEVPLLSTVLIPDMGLLQRGRGCGRGGQRQTECSDMVCILLHVRSHDDSGCASQISSFA